MFQGSKTETDGSQRTKGTNTLFWINKEQVPKDKTATYARVVVDKRPEKEEVNQTRITAGDDRLEFQGDTSTKTAGLETVKMVFNSVVSTPDAKFMTVDISNMYLNTQLNKYQYMQFNLKMISQEVINPYGLQNKATKDRWVCCEIRTAICGLKKSGKLANIELQAVLATEGCRPCRFTHGLYKHETRDISFLLVVDNFGVKFTNKTMQIISS